MENITKKSPDQKKLLKSWRFWKPALGVIAGCMAGFLYFRFAGCSNGTCLITSHSYTTVIFGGLSGYLIAS